MSPRLCRAGEGLLLLVDLQSRLAAAMAERERVIAKAATLTQAADLLGIPVLATEQYPRGLGPTEPAVAERLPTGTPVLEKTCFACGGAAGFAEALAASGRRQVVVAGMETHVCVLQTALGLAADGYEVFVAEDAVCSRETANHRNALERMRPEVVISNTESILFEWLGDARHEQFKAISTLIK